MNVNGMIICSNPSSLLRMTILCFFPSSKASPLITRNLALWNGLNEIGLPSDNIATLTISSEVATKIDFFETGISSIYMSRDTIFPPKGIGGLSKENINPSCTFSPFTIVTFFRLPSIYESKVCVLSIVLTIQLHLQSQSNVIFLILSKNSLSIEQSLSLFDSSNMTSYGVTEY